MWLVRAGQRGRDELYALDNGVAVVDWSELGDLSGFASKEALFDRMAEGYGDAKEAKLRNWTGQLWSFLHGIQHGDFVALPLKSRPSVAIGKVTGGYRHVEEAPDGARNQLPVEWLGEVPRSRIPNDVRYSLGAFMAVCRIERNDAESRLLQLLRGGVKPEQQDEPEESLPDFETDARDRIRALIQARYKGNDLEGLVCDVLVAQGLHARLTRSGADGGVDVVAGGGPLGFDSPRLVVQVKSQQDPVDVRVIRELKGVMDGFGADRGLLVAWGGFKDSVLREADRQHFSLRLWSGDDLIDAVLSVYEQLPEATRAKLAFKRIWVPTEE